MLKQMGWSEDRGLGARAGGMLTPLDAIAIGGQLASQDHLGIGFGGGQKHAILPDDDYKTRIAKKARARYEQEK